LIEIDVFSLRTRTDILRMFSSATSIHDNKKKLSTCRFVRTID